MELVLVEIALIDDLIKILLKKQQELHNCYGQQPVNKFGGDDDFKNRQLDKYDHKTIKKSFEIWLSGEVDKQREKEFYKLKDKSYLFYDKTQECNVTLENVHESKSKLIVQVSNKHFFSRTHKFSYKMTSRPIGYALIISVFKFSDATTRKGADIDELNMTKLLKQLGYVVEIFQNPTGDQIKRIVHEFACNPRLQNVDSAFISILSHGNNNVIYGSDKSSVKLNCLFSEFNSQRCPYLKNKPKIFIIQACRENVSGDSNVTYHKKRDESEAKHCSKSLNDGHIELISDLIVGYSTMPGCVSIRNTKHGSWFIQDFVRAVSKYSKDKDLCEILTMVNTSAKSRNHFEKSIMVLPEYRSTLSKKLYFYPGLYEKIS